MSTPATEEEIKSFVFPLPFLLCLEYTDSSPRYQPAIVKEIGQYLAGRFGCEKKGKWGDGACFYVYMYRNESGAIQIKP